MTEPIKIDLFTKKKPKAVKLVAASTDQEMRPQQTTRSVSNDPSSWEKTFMEMDAKLRSRDLFIHKVDADGCCLFRAFSHQLFGTEDQHAELRREAVGFILSNEDFFAPFMDEGVDIKSYCGNMLRSETWGGQPELQALSLQRAVNVYVFQDEGSVEMLNFPDDAPLVVLSYHDGNHYNSVSQDGEFVMPSRHMTINEFRRRFMPPSAPPPPPPKPVKSKGFFN